MSSLRDELTQDYKRDITIVLIKLGLKKSAVYDYFMHKHSMYPQKGAAKSI